MIHPELRRVWGRLYGGRHDVYRRTYVRGDEDALEAADCAESWLTDMARSPDLGHEASHGVAETLRNLRALQRWIQRRIARRVKRGRRARRVAR